MGFDPDDAPDQLIGELKKAEQEYGVSAVEEMAAESMENALRDIHTLWNETRGVASPITIPGFEKLSNRINEEIESSLFPWQKATIAASIAREEWSLGTGPISNNTLSDIFKIPQDTIIKRNGVTGPINAGFRNGSIDTFSIFLKSPISVSRRFAFLRLVGDHLIAPADDKFLPASRTYTQRQKFQRAFAQEILCPSSSLMSYIGEEDVTDEHIEDAAGYFDVSPRMVETILINKGSMERSLLPNFYLAS